MDRRLAAPISRIGLEAEFRRKFEEGQISARRLYLAELLIPILRPNSTCDQLVCSKTGASDFFPEPAAVAF